MTTRSPDAALPAALLSSPVYDHGTTSKRQRPVITRTGVRSIAARFFRGTSRAGPLSSIAGELNAQDGPG